MHSNSSVPCCNVHCSILLLCCHAAHLCNQWQSLQPCRTQALTRCYCQSAYLSELVSSCMCLLQTPGSVNPMNTTPWQRKLPGAQPRAMVELGAAADSAAGARESPQLSALQSTEAADPVSNPASLAHLPLHSQTGPLAWLAGVHHA